MLRRSGPSIEYWYKVKTISANNPSNTNEWNIRDVYQTRLYKVLLSITHEKWNCKFLKDWFERICLSTDHFSIIVIKSCWAFKNLRNFEKYLSKYLCIWLYAIVSVYVIQPRENANHPIVFLKGFVIFFESRFDINIF